MNTIDVTALGNAIGLLEFNASAGTWYTKLGETSVGRNNTFHVASLAYWANTKDMLPDNSAKPWTKGKQQAKTYFVDVRESGSDGPINNQMWLASKYGGFKDLNSNGTPATVSTWHTNTDVLTGTTNTKASAANNGYRPDNYFTGDSPDKLFTSLSQIFNSALSRSLSGAGVALNVNNFRSPLQIPVPTLSNTMLETGPAT